MIPSRGFCGHLRVEVESDNPSKFARGSISNFSLFEGNGSRVFLHLQVELTHDEARVRKKDEMLRFSGFRFLRIKNKKE